MGYRGWSPTDTDAMEVWQVADFLGLADESQPVIRGNRELTLSTDQDDDEGEWGEPDFDHRDEGDPLEDPEWGMSVAELEALDAPFRAR